jgi:hypothetical protein
LSLPPTARAAAWKASSRFVEVLAALVVADFDADVIEHGSKPIPATLDI